MTPYEGWLMVALAAFCAGPFGIALWLASSFLSVLYWKRLRLLVGAVIFLGLLASGWIPGLKLLHRIRESPDISITTGEVFLLGYLHLGLLVGVGIVLFGRRRAPQPAIPPTREVDIGLSDRLLALHRGLRPRSLFPRLPWNGIYRVKLRDWEVPVVTGGAGSGLRGFTILHLSDLHIGSYIVPEYFEAVRREVMGLERDALVLTGDFLDRTAGIGDLERWLDGLLSPGQPAFAVLGNHDIHDHPRADIERALERAGVRLLGGEAVTMRKGEGTVGIAGLDYQNWWKRFPVEELRAKIPPGALPILAAHTPCVFPRAIEAGFSVILCGHTHGGQIRLPGVGGFFIPARYGRRFQMGLYHVGGSYLHVHPGLGGPPPIRISCPPEITRIIIT